MTTTTPYSDGWVAAHKDKPREVFAGYWFETEWMQGYDDAKAGKIDAKAFLGLDLVESKT